MLTHRANQRAQAAFGSAFGPGPRRAAMRLLAACAPVPAALLSLAIIAVALSPAVVAAGLDRMTLGAIHEASTGQPAEPFARWDITLTIDDTAVRSAQRGAPLHAAITVHDRGFGGLLAQLTHDSDAPAHPIETTIELRPACTALRNTTQRNTNSIFIPAEAGHADPSRSTDLSIARFNASAASRLITAMNTDRVAIRAASYTPPRPRLPAIGGTGTRAPHAARPGWWRGVSEWRIVDLETPPTLEGLWVRITAPDGLIRGLYELDPRREGQRVPAAQGDTLTIEIDATTRLWGMEVQLTSNDSANADLQIPLESVFDEVDRGVAERVAWHSYLICGNAGHDLAVGVRAIAQRRAASAAASNHAHHTRGLASEPCSPFLLAISDVFTAGHNTHDPSASTQTNNAAQSNNAGEHPAPAPEHATHAEPVASATPSSRPGLTDTAKGPSSADPATSTTDPIATAPNGAHPRLDDQQSTAPPIVRSTPGQASPSGTSETPPAAGTPQAGTEPANAGTPNHSDSRSTRRDGSAAENDGPLMPPPRPGTTASTPTVRGLVLLRPQVIPATSDHAALPGFLILGMDAIAPEDRAIALAYQRALAAEARRSDRERNADQPAPDAP